MHKTTLNIPENSGEQTPLFAVSFSSGNLQHSKYSKVKSRLYESTRISDKCKLVVRAGDMDYIGDFNIHRPTPGQFVGVEDPVEKTMTLYPVKRIKIRPAISVDPEGDLEEFEASNAVSYRTQVDALTDMFGGSRQKKKLSLRQRYEFNTSVVSQAFEKSSIDHVDLAKKQQDVLVGEIPLLPPHDTEALTPEKAYPVSGYYPDNIREELEMYCSDSQKFSAEDLKKIAPSATPFIVDKLRRLPLDDENRKTQYASILFLNALLALQRANRSSLNISKGLFQVENESDLLNLPTATVAYIEQTFVEREGKKRIISPKNKDRLLIHIVLMALYLDNYSLNVEQFVNGAKITITRLTDVVKAMGCQLVGSKKSAANKSWMLSMKLPLTFQTYKMRAHGRR